MSELSCCLCSRLFSTSSSPSNYEYTTFDSSCAWPGFISTIRRPQRSTLTSTKDSGTQSNHHCFIFLRIPPVIPFLTAMPSSSEPPASSPITRIPYDALREIFIHCLPQYPLREIQPNKKIAPLLLCHICSSWRTVTLSSAVLWSHLCCRLTIRYKDSKLKKSEIEFIRWWKKNHGLIPPFLSLRMKDKGLRVVNERLSGDGTDEMPFLLEYIASAQYLELDPVFWATIRKRVKAGNQIEFPNLHALEKCGLDKNDPFHSVQALIAPHAFPALHRLSMGDDFLDVDYKTPFPIHWSALTHISFYESSITLDFWYTFIRAVPNLQWAFIDISELYDYEHYPSDVLPCNLPHLSTLNVNFNDTPPYVANTPFRLLLANFRTPSCAHYRYFGQYQTNSFRTTRLQLMNFVPCSRPCQLLGRWPWEVISFLLTNAGLLR